MIEGNKIAAVIPCYRPDGRVLQVVQEIGPETDLIVVVDDACPQQSGEMLRRKCDDPRLHVLTLPVNLGVGGATKAGWRKARDLGADILVKLDADGQMDPALIPALVRPLVQGQADYAKGNRFFNPSGLASMPWVRLLGNAVLSFLTKLSSGYWNIFDPVNGFTALHAKLLPLIDLDKIDNRYFFESDVLFRLGIARAVVWDVPMAASYGDEPSFLQPFRVGPEFFGKNLRNFLKRIVFSYYLRDFRPASLNLGLGLPLAVAGAALGLWTWLSNASEARFTSAGQVMMAALPIIVGSQMMLSAMNEDIQNVPKRPIHPFI